MPWTVTERATVCMWHLALTHDWTVNQVSRVFLLQHDMLSLTGTLWLSETHRARWSDLIKHWYQYLSHSSFPRITVTRCYKSKRRRRVVILWGNQPGFSSCFWFKREEVNGNLRRFRTTTSSTELQQVAWWWQQHVGTGQQKAGRVGVTKKKRLQEHVTNQVH